MRKQDKPSDATFSASSQRFPSTDLYKHKIPRDGVIVNNFSEAEEVLLEYDAY